jgi:hypothetical protein
VDWDSRPKQGRNPHMPKAMGAKARLDTEPIGTVPDTLLVRVVSRVAGTVTAWDDWPVGGCVFLTSMNIY